MESENYKPTDIVWVGACNDNGFYEPVSCEYQDLYKGKDRLPIFDTEKECQDWCNIQPQEPENTAGVDNLMSDFECLYDSEKEDFISRLKEKYPELI